MNGRRVVVTGMGAITPLGNTVKDTFDAAIRGESGITQVENCEGYPSRIAGLVKGFDTRVYLDPKDSRKMDLYTQYAVCAAKQAIADSGLERGLEEVDPTRIGVMIGSGIGGIHSWEENHTALVKGGRVRPNFIPMTIGNMASAMTAITLGLKGPNFGIVSACATGAHAIGEGNWMIKRGDADVMIVGGAEAAVEPSALAGFGVMDALSARNDEPEKASRPFDRDRDGFVIGEGAGVLILEEREHALARGARIYAEVTGYGLSCDADQIVQMNPDGPARAMKMALERAGLDRVDYINAHGTSTPMGDAEETKAIKMAFGDNSRHAWVSSTKSMTGHLLGAAGAVESIICVRALTIGLLPMTKNLDHLDPACEDLEYITRESVASRAETAMNNSFGFGGQNACLIFRRP